MDRDREIAYSRMENTSVSAMRRRTSRQLAAAWPLAAPIIILSSRMQQIE
jgi:hypothetical protein